jgi:HSP20 family molecular chaperone IbpA
MAIAPVPVKSTAPSPATTSDLWQSLRTEMDRLFDSFTGRFGAMPFLPTRLGAPLGIASPAVDITETEEAFIMSAEVPGLAEKDIEVLLSGDTLTIKGEKKQEREDKGDNVYLSERSYRRRSKSKPPPSDCTTGGECDLAFSIQVLERPMVGITLTPEQIQQAPPEVRRWIEQEITSALGLSRPAPVVEAPARHLVGCDLEQARAILSLISGMLPVTGVFFELAHEPVGVTQQGLHVLRLDDIQRHCRLQSTEQVAACLEAIDEALRRTSNSPDLALTILDHAGHCVVADQTAHSILALWQEIVMPRGAVRPVAAGPNGGAAPIFQAPYAIPVTASPVDQTLQPAGPA